MPWRFLRCLTGAFLFAAGIPAGAQLGLGRTASQVDSATVVSPASPRAVVGNFLRLAKAGDWMAAADFLAVPVADRERAPILARRLKAVIDQRLTLDINSLSPLVSGDTADGDLNGDRIGLILSTGGREEELRLVRVSGAPVRWVFSLATVNNIDAWYEALGSPWVQEHLPASLLREGPISLYLWQWLGLAIGLPVLVATAWFLGALLRYVLARLVRRTTTTWDDQLLDRLRGPFRLWAGAILVPSLTALLALNARVSGFLGSFSRGFALLAFFWGLLQTIRIAQTRLENAAWESGQALQARTLVPLLGNLLRVVLTFTALLVALAEFGYPVNTLLAGLGIGGVALALAAQKTVEHFFGSVSLAADKVLRVGVWVRTGSTEGTVERIGLRSTSIRTMERTVVRLPNGVLADDRIETFGERDRILFRTDVDLTYDTGRDALMRIRDDMEEILRAHPKVWPEVVRVNITAFTSMAIRMSVVTWIETVDYNEYLRIRHDLFLELIRIIEKHGALFAHLSRAIWNPLPGSEVSNSEIQKEIRS